MKTEWDYTELAKAYIKRPKYSSHSINSMLSIASCSNSSLICDVGAGVGHLTLELAKKSNLITAIEPNDAMRKIGIERTKNIKNVNWIEATGENTAQADSQFNMVTFGSSFNVCNRLEALTESKRILRKKGWFACMWNHRDLNSEIQSEIELIIKNSIPEYSYGTRREDQSEIIRQSGLFEEVVQISSRVIHKQELSECIEAWKSHATLERQAKDKFGEIIKNIELYLNSLNINEIEIPYETKIWMAQLS